jgi:hypothetical protein
VYGYLSGESYWSTGIPRTVLDKAIENSLVFGILESEATVAFARVVTDRPTFAWLCDVFVLPDRRGTGLARG